VTTGVVVVVVVGAVPLLPDEPDESFVGVEVDDPEELVVVDWDRVEAATAPGCSLATATPINAAAPVAARIAVRVNERTRECARCRASGVLCSLGFLMGMHLLKSARLAPRSRPSVGRL